MSESGPAAARARPRPYGAWWLLWPFWSFDERRLRALWRLVLGAVVIGLLFRLLLAAGVKPGRLDLASTAGRAAATVVGVLIATWLLDRRALRHLGLRVDAAWLDDFVFGSALGVALIAIGVGGLSSVGWMDPDPRTSLHGLLPAIATSLLVLLLAALLEEVLFRSWLLRNLADGLTFGPIRATHALVAGTVISSALFGLGHASNPGASMISGINIAAAGAFLALPYLLTGRLGLSWGVHWTWNVAQGPVFGIPVSGIPFTASLVTSQETGPDVWTGGPFGIEAGVTALVLMVIGSAAVVAWVRWREGRVQVNTALIA